MVPFHTGTQGFSMFCFLAALSLAFLTLRGLHGPCSGSLSSTRVTVSLCPVHFPPATNIIWLGMELDSGPPAPLGFGRLYEYRPSLSSCCLPLARQCLSLNTLVMVLSVFARSFPVFETVSHLPAWTVHQPLSCYACLRFSWLVILLLTSVAVFALVHWHPLLTTLVPSGSADCLVQSSVPFLLSPTWCATIMGD